MRWSSALCLLASALLSNRCVYGVTSPPRSAHILDVAELNADQIRALDPSRTVVLLPGGIVEEHGPYLPSYSDGYQSDFLSSRIAEAIAARPGWTVLRFPQLPLGAMAANQIGGRYTFPGSYPVRMATLRAVYMDLATDLGEAGVKWILVVNYHGGPTHNRAMDDAGRYFNEMYGGQMVNLFGLVTVAGAVPGDLFTPAERKAEGFSVHADADEHSRMLFLRPELVPNSIHSAPAIVAHDIPDLVPLARKNDWPGYWGTPAIANAAAGRRSMEALAAAAIDASLKILAGTPGAEFGRVWDQEQSVPVFKQITDASLEHDQQVERKQLDWLARQR
jgi:creatinine amidohydrolase/Fe(II)-dependent formamide hydrolase-like protein